MNEHVHSTRRAVAGVVSLLVLVSSGCRREPAPTASPSQSAAPAPVAAKPNRATPPAPATVAKTPAPPVNPLPPNSNPPPPPPGPVSIPVDGPDLFLRDKRPVVNYAEAFERNTAEARKGSARAQARLGMNYWNAHGTERNAGTAVEWLRKAAEQGDAEGQYYLGHAYEEGFGVTKDEAEAVKWKRKALDQGYQPTLRSGGSYSGSKGP